MGSYTSSADRLIAILVAGSCLQACQTIDRLEAQSRVDPCSIALYPDVPTRESIRKKPRADVADRCAAMVSTGDFHTGAINLDCLYDRTAGGPSKTTLYQAAIGQSVKRNRLASILMKHSDDVGTVEMGNLVAREAMVNSGLGIATTALSTVSALVTGDFAKSALASGSTFTNATRDHINTEVYRNVLGTAVARAIQNERKKLRDQMIVRFGMAPEQYTVDQMIFPKQRVGVVAHCRSTVE